MAGRATELLCCIRHSAGPARGLDLNDPVTAPFVRKEHVDASVGSSAFGVSGGYRFVQQLTEQAGEAAIRLLLDGKAGCLHKWHLLSDATDIVFYAGSSIPA